MDIGGKPIPEGIRQYFGGRDTFLPNERFPDSFVQNFFVPDDAVLAREDPGAYTQRDVILKDLLETKEYMSERREETPSVNPGFGLKNVYRVAVHNNGADPHAFSYLFKGDGYDINWSASTGENGHLYLDDTIIDTPCEVFRVNIPAGQTVYITFDVSIICGKNPTAHNAFAIDVPSNILFSFNDKHNDQDIYKYLRTLYNKENARDYAYLNP